MMEKRKNVLIVGSDGRDHALAWKLSQSVNIGGIFVAPGNGGTAQIATNVPIQVDSFDELIAFAKDNNIDIVYVSGDDQLGAGLVDKCAVSGIQAFGPNQAAAQIEASKAFSKNFMVTNNIPTAKYKTFTNYDESLKYLSKQSIPIVVKASGLAAGKGAFVCHSKAEAENILRSMLVDKEFGVAGDQVIIEEFLEGPEISMHVFSDGTNYKVFPPAQDHKAILEANKGANTGGMGTLAPLPGVSKALLGRIESEVIAPTIAGMKAIGRPFLGVLYPGIMLTKDGPKVLEFNARLGDPETQSYLRLLNTDLLEIIEACLSGELDKLQVSWSDKTAVNIVLASGGYPAAYEKGKVISGIEEAQADADIVVFQAGTTIDNGKIITCGGRVLGISAIGENLDDALSRAYTAADKIFYEGMTMRRDIGHAHNNQLLEDF